jgi:uncharacterized membrane protein YkvI
VRIIRKKGVVISQIAATYIGTVVGAGFATGQEILQFFTIYRSWGLIGIMVSTILFIYIGTKMMILSHRIGAYSYQDLNKYLFGKILGTGVNVLTFVILLGVTSVMLSGTGSIFEEQLNFSYQLGILITLILCYFVMSKGLKGIFWVNSIVVPMMLFFTLIIAIKVGLLDHSGVTDSLFQKNVWAEQWQGLKWLLSAFLYVAFNLAMAQAVLVPMGREIKDENLLRWGGLWGGIGLSFMLLISHFAIKGIMPNALHYDIPMAVVIKDIGWLVHFLFLMVIYGEIFTTLIGNVFGISRQIHSTYNIPERWTIVAILFVSFMISQVGFSSLVSYLYPLFGYMGLLLLICLVFKRMPRY